jgi:hypothetical protein
VGLSCPGFAVLDDTIDNATMWLFFQLQAYAAAGRYDVGVAYVLRVGDIWIWSCTKVVEDAFGAF